MSTRHATATSNSTTAIRSRNLELLWSINKTEGVRMVLADNRETFSNTVVFFELVHDLGPHSVLALVHETGLADQIHTVLGSRQQNIGAIGRFEETDRSRRVGILGPHVTTNQGNDDDLCGQKKVNFCRLSSFDV